MVIMKKDLREALRTRSFYVSIGVMIFSLVVLGGTLGRSMIEGVIQEGLPAQTASAIQPLVGILALLLALMFMLLFCIQMNVPVMTEKMTRSIESLLCTPVTLRQIWLGKSLAMALPSVVLGLLFTFGGIAGINQFFIVPELGSFIMPGAAPLVAILVAVPLIVFFISSLVVALQLVTGSAWITAALGGLMGLIFGLGFGFSSVLSFSSGAWNIVFICLGVAAVLALVTIFLSPRLTKEKVVLSSKG